jgi:hypothetical protein
MSSRLLEFWPTAQRVVDCIKSEAESADQAVLLAVHQPMFFRRKPFGSPKLSDKVESEQDLRRYFLKPDLPEGNLILPIVGESGIGKSHAVKWLEWQLKRDKDADKRHLVRIPKGSSLRGVLRLLLEQLGDRYAGFEKALARAHDQLESREAASRLLDSIRNQLESRYREAKERKKRGMQADNDGPILACCSPERLPSLLLSQELRQKHFLVEPNGVIPLLAQHLHQDAGREEDKRRHQFEPSDLLFGEQVDPRELGRWGSRYFAGLQSSENRRIQAAELLNGVLDRAKAELLDLGDLSLTELLEQVRRQLLADGQELVLLVEDFAVLSGLQGSLLQAIIKEAVRDGDQELCTIRTALAYTPSYEAVKDTAMSRAGFEWHLVEDTERTVQRTTDLVGAYLNAARAGKAVLGRALKEADDPSDLHAWIPRVPNPDDLDDEARTMLEGFGRSKRGFALFPFNPAAVRQWTQRATVTQAQASNPRLVIKHVIQHVLENRDLFAEGGFPPADLEDTAALANPVVEHVRRRYHGETGRRLAMLRYWGDAPRTEDEAERIAPGVCQAFGLQPPGDIPQQLCQICQQPALPDSSYCEEHTPRTCAKCGIEVTPPAIYCEEHQPVATDSCHICDEPSEQGAKYCKAHRLIGVWQAKLDEWAAGKELSQPDARHLRHLIAEAVYDYVQWDTHGLLLKPGSDYKKYFHNFVLIPRSKRGAKSDQHFVEVCSDDELALPETSSPIRSALLAIVTHDVVGHWNYPDAEVESAAYAEFLSARSAGAVDFARRHYHMVRSDISVPAITETLLVGSRALGLDGGKGDNAALIDMLLRPLPAGPDTAEANAVKNWDDARRLFRSHREDQDDKRRNLLDMLLDQIGYRQGDGRPLAVDVARLMPIVRDVRKHWTLSRTLVNPGPQTKTRAEEFRRFWDSHNRLRRSLPTLIKRECKELEKWHDVSVTWFGQDKRALQVELRETHEAAQKAALIGGIRYRNLEALVSETPSIPIKQTLALAQRAVDDTDPGVRLRILGQLNVEAIQSMDEMREAFNRFFDAYENALERADDALGPDGGLQGVLDEIGEEMHRIDAALTACGRLDDE